MRLDKTNLFAVRRARHELRFVGLDTRQAGVERAIVHLEQRQRREAQAAVADNADAVFGARQELLDEDGPAGILRVESPQICHGLLGILHDGVGPNAGAAVGLVRLDERRKNGRDGDRFLARVDPRFDRDGDAVRRRYRTNERLVQAFRETRRPGTTVGNAEQFQQGGNMQLEVPIVGKTVVAEIEDEGRAGREQRLQQSGVIVEVAKAVFG